MSSARDVWELSQAALAEQDGVCAVIKVFMDESGTHDGSPAVAVGAYFARPKNWKTFTTRWNAAKKPINVFHSTDCEALKGEFKCWTEPQRDRLVAKLMPILANHGLAGVGIGIDMNAFKAAVADKPNIKQFFGTPYVVCFKLAVETIMLAADELGSPNEPIAFFHEDNDYEQEALAAFSEVKAARKKHRGEMTITFASKKAYVPLQAADVLARETNKRMRDTSKRARRSLHAMDPDQTRIKLEGFPKKGMPDLIKRLEIIAEELKVFGRTVPFFGDRQRP